MQESINPAVAVSEREMSLSHLLSVFRSGWRTIIWFIAAGAMAAAVWLVGYEWYNPRMLVYSAAFKLETKGSPAAHYPNGLKFALQDITNPSVLDASYKSVAALIPKVERGDLNNMVSVISFSPEQELIRKRYFDLLTDKALSVTERIQIEEDFSKALAEVDSAGFQINLSTLAGSVSPDGAKAPIQSLLDNWSRVYVTEFGAARQTGAIQSKLLVDMELLETRDFPIILQNLEKATGDLMARITEISGIPGTEGIAIGGRTIKDVEWEARQILLHAISEELAPAAFTGLSENPEASARKLAYASQAIRDSIAELQVKTRLIDELLAQAEPLAARQTGNPSGSSETSITQLSDATSDRLIDLAISNAAQPFKQDLLRQKQEMGAKAASLSTDLARTERLASTLGITGSVVGSHNGKEFLALAKTAGTGSGRNSTPLPTRLRQQA